MMKNFTSTFMLLFVLFCGTITAQVPYTAKDQVSTNSDPFRFGSNFGYNPPWQDEQLADIAAGNPALGISGVGVKTSRPTLPGWFVEEYGYDFRLNTFQHYADLGLKDNVCIVGFPAPEHRDQTEHCPGVQSEMFANLYEPIWDGGANGTPYNDNNYYAAYLHQVVSKYKDHVRYWEIWNEPGFDYTGNCGWREPGDPVCNWWDQNPDPCDNKLRAPVTELVRTLRISYDIIKTLDPDAYVIVAGVGFESFLDAIMRNTDNPNGGAVTPEYPHRGGAYFDVMGFHSYPHFDGTMKYWDNATASFVYERHSDKGITGILGRQERYQEILGKYGFDGVTYPEKEWIITEINGPRKQFQDFVGSPEYQRNFIIKAAVTCMRNDIHSMHIYNLGERKTFNEAVGEFDLFGLFEKLEGNSPYTQVKTDEGIAYKSTSDLIFGSTYDAARTAQLNMPSNIDGGAFLHPDGNYTYLLWAKTTQDMSEAASANYAFPSGLNINYLEQRNWEYSSTFASSQVDPNNITLTGEPAFFTESILSTDVSTGCSPLTVNFAEQYAGAAASYNWTFEGGIPATSTATNPSVIFQSEGNHSVTLQVLDGSGNVLSTQTSYVVVTDAPSADFTYTQSGPIMVFENTSSLNAETHTWVFGDGNSSTEVSPTHVYQSNGNYTITLITSNQCGASTQTANITISTSSNFNLPFNANTVLQPYDGPFRPGTNFGYNPPWTDVSLADIAAGNPSLGIKGVGVKASRPSFPGWFASEYGYDFNKSTYEHYDNLGVEENVMIIGFPSPEERDQAFYCPGVQSEMFANMYSDIWDGGANGTPYNDDNYLAAYLYKVVEIYGEDVRFWEIWNEPGFDYTGNCGWREPGDPVCNWWDENPDPCDFKLRAPIMHYVRILRISYEIIKTLQPDDYLVVAGVGFPSYLDAILRNTDNPVDGSVTADYPNGGGAYFDVMGFHAYPHFDGTMRYWDNSIGGFHYDRQSDQAIKGIVNRKNLYQGVLEKYGYDGTTHPNKEWIITESNLPRKQFQDYIGNEQAQINYLAKAVVTCYKENIHQFHVYNLGEAEYFGSATREFDLMGLYQKLITTNEYTHVVNQEGVSYKTVSDLLFGTEYDEARTNAMNLPNNIDGAAFQDAAGNYLYALWAVTTTDQSEVANATYNFPASFNIAQLTKREWDFSNTNAESVISPNGVALTGTPIYLFENPVTIVQPSASFFPSSTRGCAPFFASFQDMSTDHIDTWAWTIKDEAGNVIYTTNDQNPSYNFVNPGSYEVTLEVTNAAGTNTTTQTIVSEGVLSAGFTYVIDGNTIEVTNTSVNGSRFSWDFGDDYLINLENPDPHTYATDGLYNLELTVINDCDTIYLSEIIEIGAGSGIPPIVDFAISNSGGCGPVTVNYINFSSNATSYLWNFPGGNPSTSTEENPTVVYTQPGVYSATLNGTNLGGTTSYTESDLITISGVPTPSYTYDISNSPTIVFGNNTANGVSYFWNFGDGNVSSLPNPTHTYSTGGAYTVTLTSASGCGSASFSQILNIDGANLPPTAAFTSDNINGCTPTTISFTDQSVGATSWNWSFPGGNPSSSTEQNPQVVYDQEGTFDVSLMVTNANGADSETVNSFINILGLPSTDYTYVVDDSLVTFTNLSSNASSTSWNFMDGSFSTEQNPSHIFTQSGVYDVVLTSANGCGSTTATYSIEIVTGLGIGPVPNFAAAQASGCAPITVSFTDLSEGSPTGWNWTFPGGNPATSTDQNPTVVYNTAGSFEVSLEVINANGSNSTTQTSVVNVFGLASTNFSYDVQMGDVSFTNLTTGAVSYSWNFGDGTFSTDENPTHNYTQVGSYDVVLTGANACGSTNVTYTVNITEVAGVAPTAAFVADVFSGCAPTVINYVDQSAGSPTSWNWTFPGGTPSTSTEQNPTVTYNSGGVFGATLVAGNANGTTTSTQTDYITVSPFPTASFTSSTNGLVATFNNTSTEGTSYSWDFGDGNTSTDENPTHTYTVGGTYQVALTTTGPCGFITTVQPVSFGVAPIVAFTSNVTTGCAPLTVNFTDLSSGTPTAWDWTFAGGSIASSTDQNPTVTYTTPGVYSVSLQASNAVGSNSFTQNVYVVVEDVPQASFFTSVADLTVIFSNTTPNGNTYSWDFGDGNTSTEKNPTHIYTDGGTYTVTLTSTNDCGTFSTTSNVTLISLPTSAFSASATSGCAPMTVTFSDLSSGNVTAWEWSFPGGTPSTSTEQNPVVTYNTAGTFGVSLIATNSSGSNTNSQTSFITLNASPSVAFTSSTNGLAATFNNTSTNADSYLWDFGDGNTSTDENPTHTYAMGGGTFDVTLTATNACGSISTTQAVSFGVAPVVAFNADQIIGCAGITVNFIDLTSGMPTAWDWTFQGGSISSSTDQNPSVTFNTPGVYDITLEATNSIGSNALTQFSFIVIEDNPQADFSTSISGLTADFNNTTTNGTTYAWDFGDGNTSTAANPSHTYADGGTYTVTLTATNDCGPSTSTQQVSIVSLPVSAFSVSTASGCAPTTVTFNDLSMGTVTGWQWSFPGGTPSSSTEQNPEVTYNIAGTYDVILVATNGSGSNTNSQTSFISINAIPLVSFTSSTNGLTSVFNNTTTNGTTYAWDFGDGNTSTDANPSHTYADGGTYLVTLTATNDCGPSVTTEQVSIMSLPVPAFSVSASSGCAPTTITFSDQSLGTVTGWEWSFPGGTPSTSTEQNPEVTYNTAGTFDVTLVATNGSGSSTNAQSSFITIDAAPSVSFTSSTNGLTSVFNNTSTNGTTYAWDFGDGNTSTEANPSHTYADGGTYTVTLTATNDCGSTVTTEQISIVSLPVPAFSVSASSGCAPTTITFSDQSLGTVTGWEWSFPGGTPSTSTEQNPEVTYNTAGTFDVTLVATNGSGSSMNAQSSFITIDAAPSVSFTSSTTGLTSVFNNTSTNGTTYAWDFGDGNTSTEANPSHTYADGGTYTVTLTATNDCGSTSSTEQISIVSLPVPAFSVSASSGCAPTTVTFSDQSIGTVTGWEWSFPGGTPSTSTEQNPEVTYNTAGTFDVTLVATNGSGSSTNAQTSFITIDAAPSVSFTASTTGLTTVFNNTTTNGTTYLWDFGDGNTSTEANPTHTYADGGTYVVWLTATNDCGPSVFTEEVTLINLPVSAFNANVTSGCAPLDVSFNDLSTGNVTAWQWAFPGGSPSTSTAQNPEITYSAPGSFNVTLVVTNSSGNNTVIQNAFIVVDDVPSTSFATNISVLDVAFNNTSTNATSYAWDFGDGGVSADENPTYTYAADGTYMVTLTATNDCGPQTSTQTVTVASAPVAAFSADAQSGCSPLTINFSDLSTANTTVWSWSFPGGTPSTSSVQNPVVTYDTPGTYDVTLVGSNGVGSSTVTQPGYIVIGAAPFATFGSNTSSLTATFINTTANADSYVWDFGDGNSSTEENPTHTYAENGTYPVSLTATNECGSFTTTENIEIMFSGSAPTVAFEADATTGCAPFDVSFTDQSVGATSWSWSFPGGTPSTSTDQNPTVTYSTAGMYDVSLTASNAGGSNLASQTSLIVVNTQPTADFSTGVNGNVISFTNNSTGATSYTWDFGDSNTSTETSPTHTYAMDGTYTVTMNATNDCGTVMATSMVTVTTAPTVAFTADVTTGCSPLTVNFSDLSSTNVDSWLWDMPGATPATSTDQNPEVTYDTPGTYDVSLTATNASGNYTVTTMSMIVVETAPVATFEAIQSGLTYSFTNSSMGATSYEWNFGDGNSSTEAEPTHTYEMSGSYTVELIATNSCGSTTTTLTVDIEAAPVAGFTADTTFGCASFTVQYTDQSLNAASWMWTFDGGTPATSTDQNPTVVYETAGTYDVGLVVTNTTGSDNVTTNEFIVVQAAPTADYAFTQDTTSVTFMNNSTDATSYAWDFGDGNMSTEENPTHVYAENGTYTVTLTVTNDCGSVTYDNIILVDYTSIDPIKFIEEFELFPNPNQGQFTILIKGQPKDDLEMRLVNILGQYLHVEELDFNTGSLLKTFDFNHLSPGTYIVELRSNQQVLFKKVVIE